MDDMKCPDCGSRTCVSWDDGYLCLDCGTEFDLADNHEPYEELEEFYA